MTSNMYVIWTSLATGKGLVAYDGAPLYINEMSAITDGN